LGEALLVSQWPQIMQGGSWTDLGWQQVLGVLRTRLCGCTVVTRAFRVGAPLFKRPSSDHKASRRLQRAMSRHSKGRKGDGSSKEMA
jgi:hypothetical protein